MGYNLLQSQMCWVAVVWGHSGNELADGGAGEAVGSRIYTILHKYVFM
jgi:hypothetical protein